jgi:ribonuclease HII
MLPNLEIEKKLTGIVVGVDEVGRGPIAGPVVAAAVIVDDAALGWGINDSKKLSKTKREFLFKEITSKYPYSISVIDPRTIDNINILQATLLAMRQAISQINHQYDSIIVDGNITPLKQPNCHAIIKGDTKSLSIAAASIVAKVYRDRLMDELSQLHPHYGWHKNVGYGTKDHFSAIERHGFTVHHRRSFLTKYLQHDFNDCLSRVNNS